MFVHIIINSGTIIKKSLWFPFHLNIKLGKSRKNNFGCGAGRLSVKEKGETYQRYTICTNHHWYTGRLNGYDLLNRYQWTFRANIAKCPVLWWTTCWLNYYSVRSCWWQLPEQDIFLWLFVMLAVLLWNVWCFVYFSRCSACLNAFYFLHCNVFVFLFLQRCFI